MMGAANMLSLTLLLLVTACQGQIMYAGDIYYSTAGGTSTCPGGYQLVTDVKTCRMVATAIPGKAFAETFRYSAQDPFPVFCTIKNDDIHYFVNQNGIDTDPEISVLCMKSSYPCSVTDGTGPSAAYPCVCGTDICATDEVCDATNNICEVAKGYAETEKFGKDCPNGYQIITDAAACMEVADKITTKRWGAVYSETVAPHGCASWRTDIVHYYVNPGGYNYEVDIARICIKTAMACDVTDGSGISSSYPCTCGTDTCATNEVCIASENTCEVIKGYYQTERKVSSCPSGYLPIDVAACWELNGKLSKTWIPFKKYSGVAQGCGTWNFDSVNYYDYEGGGNPGMAVNNVENSLLCVSDNETVSYDKCLNPYTWGTCQ